MDSPPTLTRADATTPLGVPGYTFADLHDPERLASLYERFCEEVAAADAALWRDWDAHRAAPDALAGSPVALSNLLVAMAPHVSRFVTRLFQVGSRADALASATRDQDDLFRFKVDFVRRRALPLVKSGAHVASSAEDDAVVARLTAGMPHEDPELAIARAGCALLDAEASNLKSQIPTPEIESLKKWCAARLHDRAYRSWVIFRFPETLDYWRLVDVQRPDARLPEAMIGPDERLRRRDGFALTDARMKPRDVLSEIHYCVLCHERDKDSCSKGIHAKDGKVSVNPLGIELNGCPLDEKISEMHMLRKAGDAIGALAMVIAAFTGPGIAGALASAWQARRSRVAVKTPVAPTVAPAMAPFAPAEAVADIRSLTEARDLRARRDARGNRRSTALAS